MKRFIITGPSKAVNGIVNISGAKNSCLPLMAASILFKKEVILRNVPLVQDVLTMKDLLISLGSKVKILEKKKIMNLLVGLHFTRWIKKSKKSKSLTLEFSWN